MKQNHRKHVYLSFFNPLKVTGKLEIESLGWVHGGELGGGELAMGRNWYHSYSYNYVFIIQDWLQKCTLLSIA